MPTPLLMSWKILQRESRTGGEREGDDEWWDGKRRERWDHQYEREITKKPAYMAADGSYWGGWGDERERSGFGRGGSVSEGVTSAEGVLGPRYGVVNALDVVGLLDLSGEGRDDFRVGRRSLCAQK